MANGHGGVRSPSQPAAVSVPGSGRRTDGGAGSKSQPLRVPSGGRYGERKAATEQQQAAPLEGGSNTGAQPPQPAGLSGGGVGEAPAGVFGPTEQPNVNPAGAVNSPKNMAAQNPDHFLRILYSQYPTAAIGALLRRGGTNG